MNFNQFSPYKGIADQLCTCHEIGHGQGQPRVIIRTNYDGPKYPMLHSRFQGHMPFGSEEDFVGFLKYMVAAAILVM